MIGITFLKSAAILGAIIVVFVAAVVSVMLFYRRLTGLSPVSKLLKQVFDECDQIAKDDTTLITKILQQLSLIYYLDVRKQALLSFCSAFGAAVVGISFFLYAILHSMTGGDEARTALWAGGLTQFISAVNFFLYFKVARQFAMFHVCLERENRFLLANTICESLNSPMKEESRKKLIDVMAHAPMLSLDMDRALNARSHRGDSGLSDSEQSPYE